MVSSVQHGKGPLPDTLLLELEAGPASAVAGSPGSAARAWGWSTNSPIPPPRRLRANSSPPRAPSQVPFKPGPEHMGPNQLKSPTLPSANTLMASLRAGPWAELTSQLLRPKEPARDPHPSRLQLGHLSRAVCRPGTQRGIQIRGGLRLSWMPACPRAPSSSLLKATLSRRPALTSCH